MSTKQYKPSNYNKDEVKEIMDVYKKDKKMGNTLMYEYLKKYIYSIIYTQYAQYAESEEYREEFVQSVMVNICQATEKYNPEVAAPTTYYKPYILAGIRNVINSKTGQTSYYGNLSRKIRQLQEARLKKGLGTTEADCIIEMPDISPVAIRHTFEMMYAVDNMTYLDAGYDSDDSNTKSTNVAYNATPESVFFESEDSTLIYDTIETVLTPLEKDIVVLSYNLFTSNIGFLEEILKRNVPYSAIELFKAHGQSGSQALSSWGLSKKEILMFGGVSENDANFFLNILQNGGTPEEYEKMMKIAEAVESDSYKKKLQSFTKTEFERFLKHLGYNKKDVRAKETIAKIKAEQLGNIENISIEDLLRAKGLSNDDITDFLTGKRPSQAKICTILSRNAVDIKAATSQAEMKLKRALKSVFPERANKADIHMAKLNEEEIAFTADAEDYANAFMDQLNNLDCE